MKERVTVTERDRKEEEEAGRRGSEKERRERKRERNNVREWRVKQRGGGGVHTDIYIKTLNSFELLAKAIHLVLG